MEYLKTCGRKLLQWYLRDFPLRNGKGAFYERFQECLAPAERYVIAELSAGFRMKLDLHDPAHRKTFFFGSYDERHEIEMVKRVLEEREVFWDVGANIGVYSLLAATLVKNNGRIVAFEPANIAYEMLLENIALNHFDNILPFKVAVADAEGEAVLFAAAHIADGGANLFSPGTEQTITQTCRTVTLDKFSQDQQLPSPDFIKMDIEGAELAVLRGAELILTRDQPLLLIEMKDAVLKAAGTDKSLIQDILVKYGYVPAFLHRRKWYQTDDVTRVKSRNIFWFKPSLSRHREKAARIPVRTPS
ncbi:MAG: FkbM family methyltransferase [Deltaproteobacteria bacterium]|nr:FkbM family methyltransferase [Deltaproteobacteria bacterium]